MVELDLDLTRFDNANFSQRKNDFLVVDSDPDSDAPATPRDIIVRSSTSDGVSFRAVLNNPIILVDGVSLVTINDRGANPKAEILGVSGGETETVRWKLQSPDGSIDPVVQTDNNGDTTLARELFSQYDAAPFSQAVVGLQARAGHILDGGHPFNTYPTSPNADDSELNNSIQADNNTIGTHAGGDFWEWNAGDPSSGSGSYSINSTLSHLYVNVNRVDPDGFLGANTSIAASTLIDFRACLRFLSPLNTSSDEYFAIRCTDISSSNYYEVFFRNDASGPLMEVGAAYVDGGARTIDSAVLTPVGDKFTPAALWLQWRQTPSNTYTYRYSVDNISYYKLTSAAYTFSNTYVPDQIELIFGSSDAGALAAAEYFLDSFRKIV